MEPPSASGTSGGRWPAAKRARASAFRAAGLPSAEGRARRGRGRDSGRRGPACKRIDGSAVQAGRKELARQPDRRFRSKRRGPRMFRLDPATRAMASAVRLPALCVERHYRPVEVSLTPARRPTCKDSQSSVTRRAKSWCRPDEVARHWTAAGALLAERSRWCARAGGAPRDDRGPRRVNAGVAGKRAAATAVGGVGLQIAGADRAPTTAGRCAKRPLRVGNDLVRVADREAAVRGRRPVGVGPPAPGDAAAPPAYCRSRDSRCSRADRAAAARERSGGPLPDRGRAAPRP